MEIILLQDVDKVGKKGEVANVSEGYARNYLFPRKLAEKATPAGSPRSARSWSRRRLTRAAKLERAEEIRDMLAKTVLTIPAPVGAGERLFGSVTNAGHRDGHLRGSQDPRRQA